MIMDAWYRLDAWLKSFPGYENHTEQREVPGAGRGLVALETRKAGQPLLVIPSGALLNPLTLLSNPLNSIPIHLFPSAPSHSSKRRRTSLSKSLNTTQLLTLHLVLTRDKEDRHASGWKEYIDTIPQDFDWHPLSWLVHGDRRIDSVPTAARRHAELVKAKFDDDLVVLHRVLGEEDTFKDQVLGLTIGDFVWAWLNVNTRSVSVPLGYAGPTELYNHTLVPVLDLVNHSSSPTIPRPQQRLNTSVSQARSRQQTANAHLVPGRIAFALVAPEEGFEKGNELLFQYHPLSNTELWADYGFAETYPSGPVPWGKYSALIVDHLIDEMCQADADQKEALERIGCWRHNTLHPYPQYEASHCLMMTLRVLHLTETERAKLGAIGKATVTYISEENEAKVIYSLRTICQKILAEVEHREKGEQADSMVEALWAEQEFIALGCLQAYS